MQIVKSSNSIEIFFFHCFFLCKYWFIQKNSNLEEWISSPVRLLHGKRWEISFERWSVPIGPVVFPSLPPTSLMPLSQNIMWSFFCLLSRHRLEVRWFCATSVGGWLMSVSQQLLLSLFTHNAYFFPPNYLFAAPQSSVPHVDRVPMCIWLCY